MYHNSFALAPVQDGATLEQLLAIVGQRLEDAQARKVSVEPNTVSFKGGFFRLVGNWNLLVAIGSGKIELDPQGHRIAYSLSFAELLVVGTVMIGVMAMFMAAGGFPSGAFICFLPVGWLWLVGMNYLIALSRFDRFMKRCIRDSGFAIMK
jgi:hypothetical protein